jgi:predicted enzyme related to lactoylglutathione lyase
MSETGTQTQLEFAPGTFCWAELATTDGPGAKKFYGELFGWESNDIPIGPDMVYSMQKLDGKEVGALFQKDETMKDVPTHWASYVSVASTDEIAAKAKSLGGTVAKGPFDVSDAGRMAVIIDPTGAAFGIWQAGKHTGYGVKGQPSTVSWNELLTTDTARAIDFYSKLFGWVANTHGAPMEYTEWMLGDEHVGGMMQIRPDMGPVPPNWGIYFAVEDCDASFQKATSLGAQAIVPPMDIEHVGRFAVIRDPQGAVFSIIKLTPHHEEKKA